MRNGSCDLIMWCCELANCVVDPPTQEKLHGLPACPGAHLHFPGGPSQTWCSAWRDRLLDKRGTRGEAGLHGCEMRSDYFMRLKSRPLLLPRHMQEEVDTSLLLKRLRMMSYKNFVSSSIFLSMSSRPRCLWCNQSCSFSRSRCITLPTATR